jgi:SAM-dependent methyltransferase/3-polyprenyl-4-hydroxybenzoate decarboxylase
VNPIVGDAEDHRFVRAAIVRAFDRGDTTTVLGDHGDVLRFSGESAELVRAILAAVVAPQTRESLLARLSELAETEVRWLGAVADTMTHLEAAGVVRRDPLGVGGSQARTVQRGAGRRVVLGLTGAVAASFAPGLVQALQARGHEVRVAATKSALRFVGALALEALTHAPVVASVLPSDPRAPVPHLTLARWADLVVVWPATATSIARLATGACDTIVAATAIATRAPVLVVPSMNESMYLAPAVQRNLATLTDDGFTVAHAGCGFEVADAPARRRLVIGSAPPVDAVADLVDAVFAHAKPARVDWDALYRQGPVDELPWFTPELEPDLAAALDELSRDGRRVLDLGTGLGTAAIAAADRGLSVVATDVSAHAIELSAARAGDRAIVWLVDDVRQSTLRGSFDLVLDRGLLHVLDEADHAAYVATVARLTRSGGHLLLKCHSASEPDDHGARRFSIHDLVSLLGDAFERVREADAVFSGPGRAPRALLAVFRRRAVAAPTGAR